MGVRHIGQRADVGHIAQRVADGLNKHRLGLGINQLAKAGWVARIGKAHLNALLRERMGKQVVGAAVERAGGDDVVAGLCNGLDGVGGGGHARCHGQRRNTAFQRCDALFQHIGRRVHDAGVDIALHFEVKQIRAVLGAVKGIGHRLVDRNDDGFGRGIRAVSSVHGQCFDAHVCLLLWLIASQ